MSIAIKFDRILGRLREKDGGSTPTPPPDPTSHFTVSTSPNSNKTFVADTTETDSLTVTVTLRFDNAPVDADSTPNGWTHTAQGTYTRTINAPGTIAAQAWSYTPGGEYGQLTVTKNSAARSLTKIWPAYWGIYPSNDTTATDISKIVATLNGQHRRESNLAQTTVEINNTTEQSCWLWIVVRESGSATAEPTATPGLSMMEAPVTGKEFTSPISGNNWSLSGYKAYVSTFSAKAGASFGQVNLSITL